MDKELETSLLINKDAKAVMASVDVYLYIVSTRLTNAAFFMGGIK